jgi:hypothetical protein
MRYLILSFLCFTTSVLTAQYVRFTEPLKEIPDLITQTRFNKANTILSAQKKLYPDNRAVDYLQAATLAMDLFVNADETQFNQRFTELEVLLSRIEDLPKDEPWRNVFLGELKVALAILQAKFKNMLKGGWQFYQAYGLLEDNAERFPEFSPNSLSFGVLQAALGSIPEDYRSIASFFGLEGDLDKGMASLKRAYWKTSAKEETKFLRNYYGFIYSFVNFQLFNSQDISPEKLGLDLEGTGFLVYLQALMDASDGEMVKAIEILKNRQPFSGEERFHYLDYLLGKYALAINPNLAYDSFQRFLARPNNQSYKKSTFRYLAWYYILEDNQAEVERYRAKILNEGNTALGADKQALLEARQGFNPTLVKGRLYFDSGLYTQSLEALNALPINTCCPSVDEKVELFYRKGRVYQKIGKSDLAINAYQKATAYPDANSTYALTNGYLQLGLLHQQNEQIEAAKEALEAVSDHKGFPFYESLHQKAKAALSKIE